MRRLTNAERLAIMMNDYNFIPDSAIDEFEKDEKGTIKKYKKMIKQRKKENHYE